MKNMYCELYQKECPWTLDDEREPYCTREAECPFEEDLPYDDDDFEAEYREIMQMEAEDYVKSLKATMQNAWDEYDRRMKNGEDTELSDDYFEAELTLRDWGIEFNPAK